MATNQVLLFLKWNTLETVPSSDTDANLSFINKKKTSTFHLKIKSGDISELCIINVQGHNKRPFNTIWYLKYLFFYDVTYLISRVFEQSE
jgi:hypothetical protein